MCVFCQIVAQEIKAKIIYEDNDFLAFEDIHKKAEIHYLIIPKKHIDSVFSEGSENVIKEMILRVKKIVEQKQIIGFKLLFNVGKEGGQTINHLHLHFLSGKGIEKLTV